MAELEMLMPPRRRLGAVFEIAAAAGVRGRGDTALF